jgi:hypothetical protein
MAMGEHTFFNEPKVQARSTVNEENIYEALKLVIPGGKEKAKTMGGEKENTWDLIN